MDSIEDQQHNSIYQLQQSQFQSQSQQQPEVEKQRGQLGFQADLDRTSDAKTSGVDREAGEKIISRELQKLEINDEDVQHPVGSSEQEELSEVKLQNLASNVDAVGEEQDRNLDSESKNELHGVGWGAKEVKEEGLDQVEAAKGRDSEERSESKDGGENERDKEEEVDVNENVDEDGESGSGPVSAFEDWKSRRYPIRPDAEDCPYYMKTGTCKFGSNCKFNHPPGKISQFPEDKVKQKEGIPERPGQIECKYYLTSGGCKYGRTCKFNHGRAKTPGAPILEFNFLGLPIRPGEKECPYYMRTGSCKYGSNCIFNHPDPTAVGGSDLLSGHSNDVQGASHSRMSSWSSPGPLSETTPFVPMLFPPTQRLPSPNPGMNGYQAPVYRTSERSLPTPPAFAMTNPATDTNFYPHLQQQVPVDEFPERPGQPECSYYMKTGDCKYRSGCKYHHPKSRIPKTAPCVLSDRGLPLRPEQSICAYYSRYGICKFGPACRYNHPENHGNLHSSAWSGADKPPHFSNTASQMGLEWQGVEDVL